MLELDLSGLEALSTALEDTVTDIPYINMDFLNEEFEHFKEKVKPITPIDEGWMRNVGWKSSEPKKGSGYVEQNWRNDAPYASYVNDGTKNPDETKNINETENPDGTYRIVPHLFFQNGLHAAKTGREERYFAKLENEWAEQFRRNQ